MLEIAEVIEVETDENSHDLRTAHSPFTPNRSLEKASEDSKSKCKICWCLDCTKTMKNTAEVCHAAGGAKPPKSTISNTKKNKRETAVSQRLINFVLYMYHQLTSEQRSQIFTLLQKKTKRKEIASIVGTSEATISRELKNNSTPSGKYIWTKAQDMAMQRRKRTVTNARLPDELVWRIKGIYHQ